MAYCLANLLLGPFHRCEVVSIAVELHLGVALCVAHVHVVASTVVRTSMK